MRLAVWAPDGAPEVAEGDDLAAILVALLATAGPDALADGVVVAVTSKVVAKADGRVRPGPREDAVAEETVRVVARRGPTTIVRTRHGLTLAAAGVDVSNIAPGHVGLLPVDPDASARALRRRLSALTGRTVGEGVGSGGAQECDQDRGEVVTLRHLGGAVGRPHGQSHDTSPTAAAAIAAVASTSVISSGTARQARPASTTRRTSSASASSTSQPSRTPPAERGP